MELKPAAAEGRNAVFNRVWLVGEPVARRVIARQLRHQDAEDALQSVALGVLRVIPQKRQEEQLALAQGQPYSHDWTAYIATAARNAALRIQEARAEDSSHSTSLELSRDLARRNARAEERAPDALADADQIPDPHAADTAEAAIAADICTAIRPTLDALPPEERAAFLAHLADQTDKSAARAAGIPEPTHRHRRHRAATKLRLPLLSTSYYPPSIEHVQDTGVLGAERAQRARPPEEWLGGLGGAQRPPSGRGQSPQSRGHQL